MLNVQVYTMIWIAWKKNMCNNYFCLMFFFVWHHKRLVSTTKRKTLLDDDILSFLCAMAINTPGKTDTTDGILSKKNQLKINRINGNFNCIEVDTYRYWVTCTCIFRLDDACAFQMKQQNIDENNALLLLLVVLLFFFVYIFLQRQLL